MHIDNYVSLCMGGSITIAGSEYMCEHACDLVGL